MIFRRGVLRSLGRAAATPVTLDATAVALAVPWQGADGQAWLPVWFALATLLAAGSFVGWVLGRCRKERLRVSYGRRVGATVMYALGNDAYCRIDGASPEDDLVRVKIPALAGQPEGRRLELVKVSPVNELLIPLDRCWYADA